MSKPAIENDYYTQLQRLKNCHSPAKLAKERRRLAAKRQL
jgi:hypothetical protein